MNIYLDGVFDIFHIGHLESIKQIKTLYPNCYLIVGVVSDEDALSYKRLPIIKFEDRCEIIKSIKYIDKVVEKSPLVIDKEFLNRYSIDLVVHGFASIEDEKNQLCFFKELIKLDKFKKVPYYDKISTTEIINKIKNSY